MLSNDGSAAAAGGGKLDLEWATIETPGAGSAAAAAAPAPALEAAAASSAAPGAGVAALAVPEAISHPLACLSPSFYVHTFDVTTAEVGERLAAALWPLQRSSFLSAVRNKPDLYGPAWVSATLVFAIGFSANLASWLAFSPGDSHAPIAGAGVQGVGMWKYDFRLLTAALGTVYPFAFLVPACLWFGLGQLGVSALSLVHLICIYGYSLAIFIPTALICAVPSAGLQWTAAVLGAALSALFVFKSLYPVVVESGAVIALRTVVPLVVALQLAFAVVLKLFFFSTS